MQNRRHWFYRHSSGTPTDWCAHFSSLFQWLFQIDSFGVLRLCRHKSSGSIFSARCLSKSSACTFSHTEHVQTERTFLSQVRDLLSYLLYTITHNWQVTHPFLNPSIATLQDSKYVYILSKFPAGGELFSHLASAGFFSEEVPAPVLPNWDADELPVALWSVLFVLLCRIIMCTGYPFLYW